MSSSTVSLPHSPVIFDGVMWLQLGYIFSLRPPNPLFFFVFLMSCESTIPNLSASFLGPGPSVGFLWPPLLGPFVASSSRSICGFFFSVLLWPHLGPFVASSSRSVCGLISVRLWPHLGPFVASFSRSCCGLIFSVLVLSIGFLWPPFALSLLIYAHSFAVGFLCHWLLVL